MDEYPQARVAVTEVNPSDDIADTTSLRRFSTTSSSGQSSSTRYSGEAPYSPDICVHQRQDYAEALLSLGVSRSPAITPDAPPPAYHAEEQGKRTGEETERMTTRDYAIEISRIMEKQLLKGLNGEVQIPLDIRKLPNSMMGGDTSE